MHVNGFTTIWTWIVSVHAGIYGMGIYAIMLPSSGFSVAHWVTCVPKQACRVLRRQIDAGLNIFLGRYSWPGSDYIDACKLSLKMIETIFSV